MGRNVGHPMNAFLDFVVNAWDYKVSLLPILLTYFIFDLPAIVRRLTRVAYVPIYFLFFPFGHSDRLYAQYFNEDDFYGEGEQMTTAQKEKLRGRIRRAAIVSAVFAMIFAPWFCGFVSAFYLSPPQFNEFLIVLLTIKMILMLTALRNLRYDSPAISSGRSFYYVAALYGGYLLLVWRGLTKSYQWTHSHLNSTGFWGVASGLLDYAYVDILINVIVVAGLTWAITTRVTDPSNIPEPERPVDQNRETAEVGQMPLA